nr:divalent-cation tolerance protein CutA [Wolbachia endosymbiont of Pentalonia nigronervosa]
MCVNIFPEVNYLYLWEDDSYEVVTIMKGKS